MIIYPDRDYSHILLSQGRQCGKTNMYLAILEAVMESKLTNKPVKISFGMRLIRVEDL